MSYTSLIDMFTIPTALIVVDVTTKHISSTFRHLTTVWVNLKEVNHVIRLCLKYPPVLNHLSFSLISFISLHKELYTR